MSSQENPLAKVIAQAWSDEAFKQRLLSDPASVFAEAGIDVPAGVELRTVEDTDDVRYFVLPQAPAEGEISEDELGNVAGGWQIYCEASSRQ